MQLPKIDDIIETPRCILKIPQESEAEKMLELINKNTLEFMPWSKCKSIKEQQAHIKERHNWVRESVSWSAAIYLKSWEMIGSFWVPRTMEKTKTIEIGYWLWEKYQWKWYMSEVLKLFVDYIYCNFNTENIIVRVNILNKNSCKVAERCNFKKDWILRKDDIIRWKYEDIAHYSYTKEDYLSQID